MVGWDNVRLQKRYYLTRMIVCIAPAHNRWWKNRATMNEQPQEWRASPDTIFPTSDPAPTGKLSEASKWPQSTWQEMAETALTQKLPAHLTLLDSDGHPIPIRVHEYQPHSDGFRLIVPRGAPWSEGKATLSFVGKEVFVGDAIIDGGETLLRVERALPVLPLQTGATAGTVEIITNRMESRRSVAVNEFPLCPSNRQRQTAPYRCEGARRKGPWPSCDDGMMNWSSETNTWAGGHAGHAVFIPKLQSDAIHLRFVTHC